MRPVRNFTLKLSVTRGVILSMALVASMGTAAWAIPLHQTPRVPAYGGAPPYAGFQWKPFRIVYSGDGSALLAGRAHLSSHLRWSTWNARQGRGSGANWLNNCVPDCARGTFFAYRANIRVYRPRHLGGYLLFTRMTVTYTGKRPPYPAYAHGPVTFKLAYSGQNNMVFWNGD